MADERIASECDRAHPRDLWGKFAGGDLDGAGPAVRARTERFTDAEPRNSVGSVPVPCFFFLSISFGSGQDVILSPIINLIKSIASNLLSLRHRLPNRRRTQ